MIPRSAPGRTVATIRGTPTRSAIVCLSVCALMAVAVKAGRSVAVTARRGVVSPPRALAVDTAPIAFLVTGVPSLARPGSVLTVPGAIFVVAVMTRSTARLARR